jgi:hypothetical protein
MFYNGRLFCEAFHAGTSAELSKSLAHTSEFHVVLYPAISFDNYHIYQQLAVTVSNFCFLSIPLYTASVLKHIEIIGGMIDTKEERLYIEYKLDAEQKMLRRDLNEIDESGVFDISVGDNILDKYNGVICDLGTDLKLYLTPRFCHELLVRWRVVPPMPYVYGS